MPRESAEAFTLPWWLEDTTRWDLLRFEADHDEEGLPVDRWWKDRRNVLETLIRTPAPTDHDFARFLLDQEVEFHHHSWGFSHSMEIAAILLAEHRRPEDVWPLWEAVCTSFDTWCGLPHEVLFAAGGTARTLEYVTGSSDEQRDHLLEHLHELAKVTAEDAAEFLATRRRYYTDVFLEPDG